MPTPPARRPTRLATALARLEGDLEALAREWLLRTLERRSLAELERLSLEPLARELPALAGAVLADVSGTGRPLEGAEWVGRLAAVAGAGDAYGAAKIPPTSEVAGGAAHGAEVAQDVAALEWVMLGALALELADEPVLLGEAIAGVTRTFAAIHAPALEALLAARSAPEPHDPVTRLPRGTALSRDLDALVALHERYGRPFAVLVLDVDGLGRLNDAHGRAAGDRALRAVARAAQASVRRVDSLARLDDADLAVLLPEQEVTGATPVAERIVAAVRAADLPERERVTASIGIAACPLHGTDAGALLGAAEAALLRAKAGSLGVATPPEDEP